MRKDMNNIVAHKCLSQITSPFGFLFILHTLFVAHLSKVPARLFICFHPAVADDATPFQTEGEVVFITVGVG